LIPALQEYLVRISFDSDLFYKGDFWLVALNSLKSAQTTNFCVLLKSQTRTLKMNDILFNTVERMHGSRMWGKFLDAGTGLHSIKWVQLYKLLLGQRSLQTSTCALKCCLIHRFHQNFVVLMSSSSGIG